MWLYLYNNCKTSIFDWCYLMRNLCCLIGNPTCCYSWVMDAHTCFLKGMISQWSSSLITPRCLKIETFLVLLIIFFSFFLIFKVERLWKFFIVLILGHIYLPSELYLTLYLEAFSNDLSFSFSFRSRVGIISHVTFSSIWLIIIIIMYFLFMCLKKILTWHYKCK